MLLTKVSRALVTEAVGSLTSLVNVMGVSVNGLS